MRLPFRPGLFAVITVSVLVLLGCAPAAPSAALPEIVPLDETRPTFLYFYTEN